MLVWRVTVGVYGARMTIRMVQENADVSVHPRESLTSFTCKSINKGIFALPSWVFSMAQYVQS